MDYYGTEPSSDFFAHYGVRGMKWGVRKAIERKDSKALSRQYNKALKKAKKLNTKASISKSQAEFKGRMSDAAAAGATGAAAVGIPLGLRSLFRASNTHVHAAGVAGLMPFYYDSETAPKYTTPIGGALMGLGAYQLGKGLAAKYRTTKKGHAKAAKKAEAWKSEMKRAFKGTKYSQLPGANGQNKAYEYTPIGGQFKSAAVDSVTYPGHSMNKRIAREPAPNYKKKRRK